jgi:hypothetical protein
MAGASGSSDKALLSDKALGVFAFALYHQLASGEPVSRIVRDDGSGHKADEGAVAELAELGLVETSSRWISFTPAGLEQLRSLSDALRSATPDRSRAANQPSPAMPSQRGYGG